MQDSTAGIIAARRTHAITVVLAAMLVAVAAVLVLAKHSGAQTVPPVTLNVDETEVGFGAVLEDGVGGSVATRTITVTNTGNTPITIGGARFKTAAGEVLNFSTDIDPVNGLTIGSDGAATLTVKFDPTVEGAREATLTLLEGLVDGTTGQVIGLTGETVGLVGEAGNTVQAINLSGTGSQNDPFAQPGAQGCTIVGTNNGEVLTGTRVRDVICALGGADRVSPRGGNDSVKGGGGNDDVRTSGGADMLRGGFGRDRMTDKAGKDKLYGQGGTDTLNTRDRMRADLLVGGPARDKAAVKDRRDTARSI